MPVELNPLTIVKGKLRIINVYQIKLIDLGGVWYENIKCNGKGK